MNKCATDCKCSSSRKVLFSAVMVLVLVAGIWTWASETTPHQMTYKGPGVAVMSSANVKDTVAKLKKMVADNGMMVMGELNQGKMLSMTGLKVDSQSIFVGNPQVGKKAFEANAGVGIVLPVRINVHVCPEMPTMSIVRYIPPSSLIADFDDPTALAVAKMVDDKLSMMVGMIK